MPARNRTGGELWPPGCSLRQLPRLSGVSESAEAFQVTEVKGKAAKRRPERPMPEQRVRPAGAPPT